MHTDTQTHTHAHTHTFMTHIYNSLPRKVLI